MPVPPSATQWSQLKVVSSFPSPQKYTQHLLSGTPAFHDHAHVGVTSHAGATSNQSPCFCKGMSGVPLTSDITGGPLGTTRTLSSFFISSLDGCRSYRAPSCAACTAITTHSLSGVAPRAIYTRTREPSPGWR